MRTARPMIQIPLPPIQFNHSDYDYLPLNFQPPQGGSAGFRIGKEALIEDLPTPFLPNGLLSKRGFYIQPPRFHYGWAFTPDESDSTKSPRVVDPPGKKELAKVLRELGIHTCSPDFNVVYAKKGHISISLTNNYKHGNRRPPDEDVQAIQKSFGMQEPAGLFLEAEACRQWGPRFTTW